MCTDSCRFDRSYVLEPLQLHACLSLSGDSKTCTLCKLQCSHARGWWGRHDPPHRCASHSCGFATGTRDAIQEQLRLGQELRRKVEAPGSASMDDSDGEDSATDASDGEDAAQEDLSKPSRKAVAKTKAAAMDILQSESSTTRCMPCQQCSRGWGSPLNLF